MATIPPIVIDMQTQMSNSELADAIEQAFRLLQQTHESNEMSLRLTDHFYRLINAQYQRAAVCCVESNQEKQKDATP